MILLESSFVYYLACSNFCLRENITISLTICGLKSVNFDQINFYLFSFLRLNRFHFCYVQNFSRYVCMFFLNINKIFCSFQQIHKHFAKKFPNLPMNNWIGFHVSTKQSRIFLVLRQSVSADRGSFRVGVHFFSFCLTTMKIISVIKLMLLVSFWLMLCVLSTCF